MIFTSQGCRDRGLRVCISLSVAHMLQPGEMLGLQRLHPAGREDCLCVISVMCG